MSWGPKELWTSSVKMWMVQGATLQSLEQASGGGAKALRSQEKLPWGACPGGPFLQRSVGVGGFEFQTSTTVDECGRGGGI